MDFNLFNFGFRINGDIRYFYISLFSVCLKGEERRLLHIGNDMGTWKIQLLWLSDEYWVIK